MTLTEIKDAIGALPRRADGKVKTVPVDLRGEIVVQTKSCGDEVVSRELGIHPVTIYDWRRRKKTPKTAQKFQRVEVLPELMNCGLLIYMGRMKGTWSDYNSW